MKIDRIVRQLYIHHGVSVSLSQLGSLAQGRAGGVGKDEMEGTEADSHTK